MVWFTETGIFIWLASRRTPNALKWFFIPLLPFIIQRNCKTVGSACFVCRCDRLTGGRRCAAPLSAASNFYVHSHGRCDLWLNLIFPFEPHFNFAIQLDGSTHAIGACETPNCPLKHSLCKWSALRNQSSATSLPSVQFKRAYRPTALRGGKWFIQSSSSIAHEPKTESSAQLQTIKAETAPKSDHKAISRPKCIETA